MKKITLILITLFAFIYANAQYTVPRALPYKDTRWVENTGVAGATYLFDSIVMFRNIADTQMKPLYPAMGYLQNFDGDSTLWIWDMVRWKKLATGSGGGTGTNNTNLGSAYRWLNETSQGIKTVNKGFGIGLDSLTTGEIRITADTSKLPTRYTIDSLGLLVGTYTVDNGLTASTATNFQLGGTLLHNTTITGGAFGMLYTSSIATHGWEFDLSSGGNSIYTHSTTGRAILASTSGFEDVIQANGTNGTAVRATSTNAVPLNATISKSSSGDVKVLELINVPSVGASNGIGSYISYNAKTSDGTIHEQTQLHSIWTNATVGTRTSQFILSGVNNTTTQDLLTISGNGSTKLNKYGLGTFTGTETFGLAVDASGNVIEVATAGGGTVTSFSAGNLSPLFTTSVATSTTTPALTFSLTNATGGTVFGNNTGSSAAPAYTSVPVLGIAGTTKGTIGLAGNTSGVVTIQPAAAAGTFNFNLPITAGTSGFVLTSAGGGSSAMTWTDPATIGAVSSVSNADGTLTISPTTGAVVASIALSHANTWTGLQTLLTTAVNTTSTNGLVVTNTTAATISQDQWSPAINLHGSAWKSNATAASQTFDWYIQNKPATGTGSITSTLSFDGSNNGGAQFNAMTLSGNASGSTLTVASVAATTGVTTPTFPSPASGSWIWNSVAKLFNTSGNLQLTPSFQGIVTGTNYMLDAYGEGAFTGGINVRQLTTPAPTASITGVAGSTTIVYKIVARLLNGQTTDAGSVTVTTANATLSGSNFVQFAGTNIVGAYQYDLYRVSTNGTSPSAGQVGKISSTSTSLNTLQDKGTVTGVGDGTTAPATNTTADIGIGVTTATASLHIKAGVAGAGGAPLKFNSGTLLTTPETGAVEYDGTDMYLDVSSTRYTLSKSLVGSATLDFPSTSAQTDADLTITVTGAASGDVVILGVPNGSTLAGSCYSAWVSSANTVTVRFSVYAAASKDPASGTFKVRVIQ